MATATTQKSSTTKGTKASGPEQVGGGTSAAGPSREAAEQVTHQSVSLCRRRSGTLREFGQALDEA